MTRTVALGAVIGFAVTIVVMAIWERSASTGASAPTVVDAGVVLGIPLQVLPIGRPLDIRPGPGPVAELPLIIDPQLIRRPRQPVQPGDGGP